MVKELCVIWSLAGSGERLLGTDGVCVRLAFVGLRHEAATLVGGGGAHT